MRIASFEVIAVGLPFRRPYRTATGELERREMLILRLGCDDGSHGWGDAVPMSLRGGPGLDAVAAELERACGAVVGHELDVEPARAASSVLAACAAAGAGRQAMSAVDIALLDLLGRRDGVPAWRLLGAEAPVPVRCNATIGADPAAEAADAAARAVRDGFGTVKVKVGTDGDVERVRAIRAAAGPGVRIRVDANGAWTVAEARSLLAAMEPAGLELAEQPCATAAELAELKPATQVPIVADESVNDLADAREAFAGGAMDAATLKLAKVGGPRAALAIAAAIPAYLSSALDSVIGIAAAAHAATAMRREGFAAGLAHGLATSPLFTDNVGDAGNFGGPEIEPADAPGLGIAVDEDAIERLRLT